MDRVSDHDQSDHVLHDYDHVNLHRLNLNEGVYGKIHHQEVHQ